MVEAFFERGYRALEIARQINRKQGEFKRPTPNQTERANIFKMEEEMTLKNVMYGTRERKFFF